MVTQIYKDISKEFKFDTFGKVEVNYGTSVINDSIRTILSTSQGERVMNPLFGSNLKSYLFEIMNDRTALKIKSDVRNSIELFEDRINIIDVVVDADLDSNFYEIFVLYKIIATNQRDLFTGKIKKL